MNRPTKIRDFEVSTEVDKEVLWLDVPVDHLPRVAVVEGICQLRHILCVCV